jgi:tRNA (guanine-N7-)-methyltransferase
MGADEKNFNRKPPGEMNAILRVNDEIPPENREEAVRYFLSLFGNRNPLVVELGSGNGHFLVEYAVGRPDRNFIGTEKLGGRAEKFRTKAEKRNLKNLVVFRGEIRRFVWEFLYDGMVSEFVVLFPDPWPKKRHHKHRLFSKPFVDMIELRLLQGGCVSIATDSEEYRDRILEEFGAGRGFISCFERGYGPYPADLPETLFLKRFRKQGKDVCFMRFRKEESGGPQAGPLTTP